MNPNPRIKLRPQLLIHSHQWGEANKKSYAGKLYTEDNLRKLKDRGVKVYAISPGVAYQSNHP